MTSKRDTRKMTCKKFIDNAGFTLVELITVIVMLAVLAATALPKFINVGKEARIASVNQLAGSLRSTANLVYAKCMATPACDLNDANIYLAIDGVDYWLNFGWPDSGDILGWGQIDAHINYTGFDASLPAFDTTRFTISNASDPSACYVDYHDAFFSGNRQVAINTVTTGC